MSTDSLTAWCQTEGQLATFRCRERGHDVHDRREPPSTAMRDAVQADLADLQIDTIPGGRTYQATALWLAQVIDTRGRDDGPSVTAKLADQLTKVMQLLTRKGADGDDDDFKAFTQRLSQPSIGG